MNNTQHVLHWAGYDEMGAEYYHSFRGKKTANDFNITLLVSTFLNPLIEMAFQDHLKRYETLPSNKKRDETLHSNKKRDETLLSNKKRMKLCFI